ncbi:MAG: hypothetical protein F6K10_17825 [Moorea sp. SIO2B7]|nr:hypothetical protein [Moorena sp. SIO2B7]
MDEESLRKRLEQEFEADSTNKLTELGNQALKLGLIAGHGYRGGKYEILRQGKFLLMSSQEAKTYLEKLIQEIGG